MSLNHEVYGDGEHLVLGIHGWGGGYQTFVPVSQLMGPNFQIYSPDMPGYGGSPALTDWTVDAMRQAVVEFVDSMPEGQITLLGNCSGAIFGMLAVQARPERFRKLILIDPFAYFPWYFRLMTAPLIGRFIYMFTFANPIGRFLTNLGLASKRTEETDLTNSFSKLDHNMVYEHLLMLKKIGSFETFSDLSDHPIQLCIGEKTFGAIRHSVKLWKSIWPDASVIELKGAGHLPIQEATGALVGLLESA